MKLNNDFINLLKHKNVLSNPFIVWTWNLQLKLLQSMKQNQKKKKNCRWKII